MSSVDRKRAYRRDLLLACAMVAAGLALCGLSLVELKTRNPEMAQATPPLQSSPTPTPQSSPPPESPPRRVKTRWRAPDHAGARACPPRYSGGEGGRYTYAAAGSGREDCPA